MPMKNYSSAHKQDFVVQWYNSMIIHWLIANLEEFMQVNNLHNLEGIDIDVANEVIVRECCAEINK